MIGAVAGDIMGSIYEHRPIKSKAFPLFVSLRRGAVQPHIGDRRQPDIVLGIGIVEIAEAGAEEEVLANVAERPLDLTLGLLPDTAGRPSTGSHSGGRVRSWSDYRRCGDRHPRRSPPSSCGCRGSRS